jgi:hypothetical protein
MPPNEIKIPIFGKKDLILQQKSENDDLIARIQQLEQTNAGLSKNILTLKKDIHTLEEKLADKDVKSEKLSKQLDLATERLQEGDYDYYWASQEGVDEIKSRYSALGESLKLLTDNLQKNGEVCNLTEIKNGDFITTGWSGHIYFKGSTPPSLWNDILTKFSHKDRENKPIFDHLICDSNTPEYKISKYFSEYGEVLDVILYSNSWNDYIFYDGAHYFILYFENYKNLNVEKIVNSYLQDTGLRIEHDRSELKLLEKAKNRANNFEEMMAKENKRIDMIKYQGASR